MLVTLTCLPAQCEPKGKPDGRQPRSIKEHRQIPCGDAYILIEETAKVGGPPLWFWSAISTARTRPTQEYDRVVLAMACGTPEQWKGFNADWNDLLEHYPAPPLHTKQAVSLKGEFSPENQWDRDRVDDFIISAVKVIRKHMGILAPGVGPARYHVYDHAG